MYHLIARKPAEGKIRPFFAYLFLASAVGMAVEAVGKAMGGGCFLSEGGRAVNPTCPQIFTRGRSFLAMGENH